MTAVPPKVTASSVPLDNFWTNPEVKVTTVEESWTQFVGTFSYWMPHYVNETLRNAKRLHLLK
jgi:hypothetical protein